MLKQLEIEGCTPHREKKVSGGSVVDSAPIRDGPIGMQARDREGKGLYEFGPFRVDPEKETLLREGEIVPITPKTFQILLVLVRHNQEVVTKDDLMKAVWPDTFVEEANLSRNIFMLRKALGEVRKITATSSRCPAAVTDWRRRSPGSGTGTGYCRGGTFQGSGADRGGKALEVDRTGDCFDLSGCNWSNALEEAEPKGPQ